jgi:X box-binding protein 1
MTSYAVSHALLTDNDINRAAIVNMTDKEILIKMAGVKGVDDSGKQRLLLLGLLNGSLSQPLKPGGGGGNKPPLLPLQPSGGARPGDGSEEESDSGYSGSSSPNDNSRKRKRCDNDQITEKDKREKRRIMNRIAAQNARDKKKNYLARLESKLKLLEQQNKSLVEENQTLLNDKLTLQSENKELRGIIAESLLAGSETSSDSRGDGKGCGSAVPSVSLPQERTLYLLFQVYMMISLVSFLWTMKTWEIQIPQYLQNSPAPRAAPLMYSQYQRTPRWTSCLPMTTWWGPHQGYWNPPMN